MEAETGGQGSLNSGGFALFVLTFFHLASLPLKLSLREALMLAGKDNGRSCHTPNPG